ncbi:helix-turn-helix domain-containing protein [Actinotalea solisilvae]|uniref:helix-turn-helix domain-containing protein n=1 Tax=Actinotalea solisilvae TaxID=2072922 RepID=UPI0027DBDA8E|nr:AraC family transcriptional regulator [Actinotalea solisilvae]
MTRADDAWPEGERLRRALGPEWTTLMDALTGTMFCAKDVTGRYVVVNQAFVDRTGERSRRAVVGRRAEHLFPAHLASHYAAQDEAVLTSGEPLRRELELISRPGGPPGWYLSSKVPVRDEGELVGLVSVSEDLRARDADDATLRSLHRVAALVAARLSGPLPVAAMAEAAGCSPSTLDRRMRRVFALSPQQYVLRCRVDRAAALLSAGDLPLAEVATAAGFYDQAVLTRTFGRLTGETPAQFRRRTSGTPRRPVG